MAEIIELTPREGEVLECARAGLNIRGTATRLGIARPTVATYRQQVLRKLGVTSMSQALAKLNDIDITVADRRAAPTRVRRVDAADLLGHAAWAPTWISQLDDEQRRAVVNVVARALREVA